MSQGQAERDLMAGLPRLEKKDFQRFKTLIRDVCGLKVADSKILLLENRIRRRLKALGYTTFGAYYDHVTSHAGRHSELANLWSVITTHETHFFRELRHFDILREHIFPSLTSYSIPRRLRIWSAGCSTGQEVYSLAAAMQDFLADKSGWSYIVQGSDIDKNSIGIAIKGEYPSRAMATIPDRFHRFFEVHAQVLRPTAEIRRNVRFQEINLHAFKLRAHFDVIFCRNVIMYFDRAARLPLVERFLQHLRTDGYLVIGTSETLQGLPGVFFAQRLGGVFVYRHPQMKENVE